MANPTEREMVEHLARAHRAGNTELARAIAGRIQANRESVLTERKAEQHKWALDQGNKDGHYNKIAAGIGHGMLNVINKVTGWDPTNSFDDEGKAASKALTDTTEGALGDFVGESAVLAPIGAGAGAAVRGATSAARVAKAAPRLVKALRSAPALAGVEGATEGALMADDATEGAAMGGGVASVLTGALGAGGRLVRGLVKPTQEAQQLMSKGVDLSLGQIAGPRSALGKLEGASTELPWVGGILEGARQKGRDDWVGLTIDTAVGQKVNRGKDVGEHLKNAYDSFAPRYDPIKQAPVPGHKIESLPQRAVDLSGNVPDSVRANVKRNAEDALTIATRDIPKPQNTGLFDAQGNPIIHQAPTPDTNVGKLQDVRKYVREEIRDARKAQDWDKLRLFKRTELALSKTMDESLSGAEQAALRAADADYSLYNTVESAVNRAGLEGKFTPKQLAQDIRAKAGRREFAQGGGGKLRQLAEQGDAVGLTDPPRTGTRWTTIGGLLAATGAGSVLSPVAGAATMIPYGMLVGAAKSPKVKRTLTGQTRAQQELGAMLDALRNRHPLALPTGVATGTVAALED